VLFGHPPPPGTPNSTFKSSKLGTVLRPPLPAAGSHFFTGIPPPSHERGTQTFSIARSSAIRSFQRYGASSGPYKWPQVTCIARGLLTCTGSLCLWPSSCYISQEIRKSSRMRPPSNFHPAFQRSQRFSPPSQPLTQRFLPAPPGNFY